MLEPEVPLKDPCPCGSGRKYKNCCWRRMKRERAAGRAAVVRAHDAIWEYVHSEKTDSMVSVIEAVTEPMYLRHGLEDAQAFMEGFRDVLVRFAVDVVASDLRDEGPCLIDDYLEDHAEELHPVALELLRSWRDAAISVYEVREVVRHSHLVLKDLLGNRLFRLEDAELSTSLQRWETVFMRLAWAGEEYHLAGTILPFPRERLEHVMKALEDARDAPGCRSLTWKRLLKRDWWVVPEIWIELMEQEATGPAPDLVNTDGEPAETVVLTWRLKSGSSLRAATLLEQIPEVEWAEDRSLVWVEEREKGQMDNVLVARIDRRDDSTLEMLTNSRARMERLRPITEKRIGSLVEDAEIEYAPFDRSRLAPPSGMGPDDLSPQQMAELKKQALQKLYRSWPDENLPALDGLTPRQAVKNGKGRRRVIELLKTIESGHESAGDDIDLGWLWKELGLKRP